MLSVRLTDDLNDRLNRLSSRTNISKSFFVFTALTCTIDAMEEHYSKGRVRRVTDHKEKRKRDPSAEIDTLSFGQKEAHLLRLLRKDLGLTREQVAEFLKIEVGLYEDVEECRLITKWREKIEKIKCE